MLRGRSYFLQKNLALERWVALWGFVVFAGVLRVFLEKWRFGGGFFVDSAWWNVWLRWMADARFWRGENCAKFLTFFGLTE
jgi:hypothetical protein